MKHFYWLLLGLPFYFSCSTPRYVYAPARVNAPLLEEKNEVQLDGSFNVLSGFDGSAAYAATSHIGIMLNGSWIDDHQGGSSISSEMLPPDRINYHRASTDLGLGWFTRIDSSSKWHFEIYGGMGIGKFSIKDVGKIDGSTPYTRNYDSRLQRIFIQPAFGMSTPNVQLVFYARLLFQRYHGIETNYSDAEMEYYFIPKDPGKYYGFLEPGFSFRFYIPSIPFIGFETNWMLSRGLNNNYINSIPVNATFGLHLRFQKNSLPK